MKNLIVGVFVLLGFYLAQGQAWNGIGDQKFQAGVNLWGKGDFGVKASYDLGIANAVSLGIGGGIYFNGNSNDGDNKSELSLYGRANYHLNDILEMPSKWDLYPGITMGVLHKSFDFGAHIGVRYFFTENIGAYAEIGNRGGLGVSLNF